MARVTAEESGKQFKEDLYADGKCCSVSIANTVLTTFA